MRFKLDENLPMELAGLLRDAGHDVSTVLDQQLGGSSDEEVDLGARIDRLPE